MNNTPQPTPHTPRSTTNMPQPTLDDISDDIEVLRGMAQAEFTANEGNK